MATSNVHRSNSMTQEMDVPFPSGLWKPVKLFCHPSMKKLAESIATRVTEQKLRMGKIMVSEDTKTGLSDDIDIHRCVYCFPLTFHQDMLIFFLSLFLSRIIFILLSSVILSNGIDFVMDGRIYLLKM